MKDERRTKQDLIAELHELRHRINALEDAGEQSDPNDEKPGHRQIEKALRESEEKYREIIENSNDFFCTLNLKGEFLFVSPSVTNVLGYNSAELLGKSFVPFIHPNAQEKLLKIFEKAITTGNPVVELEYLAQHKDQSWIWLRTSGRLVSDLQGQPLKFVCSNRDITEYKLAEESLRVSEERYALAQKAAHIGSWDWNITSGQIEWSEQIESLFGFGQDEYGGTYDDFVACVHPDDRDMLGKAVQDCLDNPGLQYNIEHRIVWPDKTVHWVLESGDVIRDESGTPIRMLGVVQDIDAKKQAELQTIQARDAAQAANRSKSEFIANMSHELRTPLNAVLGYAQIIRRDPALTDRLKEQVETISYSGQNLLNLINEILEISRIETNQSEVETSAIDLRQIIADAHELTATKAREKGIELVFNIDDSLPKYVETDQIKLRQILISILDNAIKFTRQGSVKLDAAAEDLDGGKDQARVLFTITDTGPGVDQDQITELFNPFTKADTGLKTQKGAGLGLPIALNYAELLGGSLKINSKPGEGTVVSITAVVKLVLAAGEDIRPVSQAWKPVKGRTPIRILIVEDVAVNRMLLKDLLQPYGFEFEEAENGIEGVELAESWQPHLIFMDLRMPEMDGIEATGKIRDAAWSDGMKIVALTASVYEERKAEVLEAGCDAYLAKPFKTEDLFGALAQLLDLEFEPDAELANDPHLQSTGSISIEELSAIPVERLAELRQSLIEGNTAAVAELVKQIEMQNAKLASQINADIEEFRYREVISLIDIAGGW